MRWLLGLLLVALSLSVFAWNLLLGLGATLGAFFDDYEVKQRGVFQVLALLSDLNALVGLALFVCCSLLFCGSKYSGKLTRLLILVTFAISVITCGIVVVTRPETFPLFTQWTLLGQLAATILFLTQPEQTFTGLKNRVATLPDYVLLLFLFVLAIVLYWFSLAGMSQAMGYATMDIIDVEEAWIPFWLLEIYSGEENADFLEYVNIIQFTFMYCLFLAGNITFFIVLFFCTLVRRSDPTKVEDLAGVNS